MDASVSPSRGGMKVLRREPRGSIKASPSDSAVVDLARRDSSSEGRTDGEAGEPEWTTGDELKTTSGVEVSMADPKQSSEVDRVILGALKKVKFNPKIKEIEQLVRDFVLNSREGELIFDTKLTDTTFERLLVHRVSQHWGLETRVLDDRCTIVGSWPEGREREAPPVVLSALKIVLEDDDREGNKKGYGRSRRNDKDCGYLTGRPYDMSYYGSVDPAAFGSHVDHQRHYYYQQMMYQQQMMMMYMQQQGMQPGMNGVMPQGMPMQGAQPAFRADVQRDPHPASPSSVSQASQEGSPTRPVPGSPVSTVSMMSMGSDSHGMGNSPMYQQMYNGYGGPPMMVGPGVPGVPYGMHVPVVPIMLPDGRIVYQQQQIQPIAVPPPPPPPSVARRTKGSDACDGKGVDSGNGVS